MEPKLIGKIRRSPLHCADMTVYKDNESVFIRLNKYDPREVCVSFDRRYVPQMIELLKESMKNEQNISN